MTRWLDRLTVARRFVLVGTLALLLVAGPTALFVRQSLNQVVDLDRQAQGIGPAQALLQLVQLTQQHRGLSALALAGHADAVPRRQAKADEVDQAAQRLQQALSAQPVALPTWQVWRQAHADWETLRDLGAAGRLPARENFGRHSALVHDLIDLTHRVGDEFGLSLDNRLDSAQLAQAALFVLPELTEALGRMRAQGAAMLQGGQRRADDRLALGADASLAEGRLHALLRAIGSAFVASPVLRERLAGAVGDAEQRTRAVLALARHQLLEPGDGSLDAAACFTAFTQAIDELVGIGNQAMATLGETFEQRRSAARRELGTLVASLALLTVIGATVGLASARSITRQLGGEPAEVIAIARAVAGGDLRGYRRRAAEGNDSIVGAMAAMQAGLSEVVRQVRASAEGIATGSSQIAGGTSDLSQRTEQQAASLQQTAASMEQMNATVHHNAETAQNAAQLAASARGAAESGGRVVAAAVATMQGIDDSSRRIADIIGVIDGIAFQTNILALNAAVEAARAGEQGRGFAVVAAEVRALARRSAAAAKEIKQLIGVSVKGVEAGTGQVRAAGTAMNDIVEQVRRVALLIQEMSGASLEQARGIGQIGQAVGQLDQVTQQNAALVEQSAAAADSLNQQARQLADVVRRFRLDAYTPSAGGAAATVAAVPVGAADTASAPTRP